MGVIFLEPPVITQNEYHARMGTWGQWMIADVDHFTHWLKRQGFLLYFQIMRDPGGQTLRIDFLRANVRMIQSADVGNIRSLLDSWAVDEWEWEGEDAVMMAAHGIRDYGFIPSHISYLRGDGLGITIAPYHRVVYPHNEQTAQFLHEFQV